MTASIDAVLLALEKLCTLMTRVVVPVMLSNGGSGFAEIILVVPGDPLVDWTTKGAVMSVKNRQFDSFCRFRPQVPLKVPGSSPRALCRVRVSQHSFVTTLQKLHDVAAAPSPDLHHVGAVCEERISDSEAGLERRASRWFPQGHP